MKLFWHKTKNFGDALAPVIVQMFSGQEVEFADREVKGKLVSTGSVIYAVREGDTVWGTGLIEINNGTGVEMPKADYCAVRGPLTKEYCNLKVNVFGDPALLLPLFYNPVVEKKYKVGVLPHYADKNFVKMDQSILKGAHFIDVEKNWQSVVDEILSCELVISSSLHGIIAAEAYGVPVMWAEWTKNIIGGRFKFQDYFLGTGRKEQTPFSPIEPIKNLREIQDRLIKAMPWKK